MKHLVILGDGMADSPIEALQGKTPLEEAAHPHMDRIAREGRLGLARTVPNGFPAGSDVANLSVFGYDPAECYSGRAPLEAASLGITLQEGDLALRCNLITLSGEERLADNRILDHSAGEISSAEATQLVALMQERFGSDRVEFHPGVSYRHCLVLRGGGGGARLIPPHDILGQPLPDLLPEGGNAAELLEMIEWSRQAFRDHPVNVARRAKGENEASSVWLWGEGGKPRLQPFTERFGVKGAVVAAVDLLRGIGLSAGMTAICPPHATGAVETDFAEKARYAIAALEEGCDVVYLHIESPDECGHQGLLEKKIWSIEQIDKLVVGPVLEYLEHCPGGGAALLMPDHPTPLALRTHTAEPVPYALWRAGAAAQGQSGARRFTEADARAVDAEVVFAPTLMAELLGC